MKKQDEDFTSADNGPRLTAVSVGSGSASRVPEPAYNTRKWTDDNHRGGPFTPTKQQRPQNLHTEGARSDVVGLDMSGFRIRNLNSPICRFSFLTELRLSNNFLTRLPAGISNLKALAFLDVSNNQFSELPSEIGWLSSLRELLLFNNHLQDLPAEFGYLFQLENLGLDGNPLNENLLQLIHGQGALAVIPFLRDHMISILPPSERTWHTIESYNSNTKSSLTVLSYNVLCDKYATPQMFGYVPSWFVNWEYRKQLLVHEILSYDADIVCLQEVETSQFEQYFKPQLRMRGGYDGVFSPKSRARTMNDWDKTFVDGCATFFKSDKFKLEEKVLIEFNQLALARPSLRKHKDMYNRVMTRDNISVIVRLEHKESRQEIILANVHIHWDPSFRDVKLVQTIMLTEELEKISMMHPKASIIACGDFNSLPDSGVCTFLESGSVLPDHSDFMGHTYEPYTTEGARHSLSLRNSYALCSEPISFTSFTSKFLGVIDYVWYKQGTLSVAGCLGSISSDYTKQLVGFPSQHFPSDHVSLLVEFKVEPNQGFPAAPSFSPSPKWDGGNRHNPAGSTEQSGHLGSRRLYSRNKNALS